MSEKVLLFDADGQQVGEMENGLISKATDPAVSNVATPGDYAAQYPQPLDPKEIIAMCDEVNLWANLPEKFSGLKAIQWRELNELAFTSGSSYVSFSDGECPEEFRHDGDNSTVTLKNIGAKKSLTISDILDSRAKAMGYGDAINTLVQPGSATEGMPGGAPGGQMGLQTFVRDLKEKEINLAQTLVMNGWDNLLVNGDTDTNSLQFSGLEYWEANNSVTFHSNATTASGSFSAQAFDRFLSEMCVKPTHIIGHSTAIQELMMAYFQLGYQGSQMINHNNGDRIIPGYNFGAQVNTGVGRLTVIADDNFTRTESYGTNFVTNLFAMRMRHNGEDLVYKQTQIPFSYRDLTPGCTSVSFQLWAKTALVVKHACAHGKFRAFMTGRTGITTCPRIAV